MVFAVARVSDGAFHRDDAEMVADREDVDALDDAGLIECDAEGFCRIHSDYWDWQTSKAELERLAEKRENDRLRKQGERKKTPDPAPNPAHFDGEPPWGTDTAPPVANFEDEPPWGTHENSLDERTQ